MPSRNSIKQYLEKGYYHIYNRGVEKRAIFMDEQDYSVFLSYLKEYLSPRNDNELRDKLSRDETSSKEKAKILKALRLNNFNNNIYLLAYCLMPNHFHFFIKQNDSLAIKNFMQSFTTRYTMYFNKKYKRVGSLFQSVYKAVLITHDSYFIHLSKYIHHQALFPQGLTLSSASKGKTLRVQPSSYPDYLGERHTEWIYPEEILAQFSTSNHKLSYRAFVEHEGTDFSQLGTIAIEE